MKAMEMERARNNRQELRGGQRGRGTARSVKDRGGRLSSVLTGANNVALGTGAVDGGEEVMEEGEEEGEEEEKETVHCGGGSQTTRGRGRGRPPINRPMTEKGRARLDSSKRKDRGVEGEEEESMLPPVKY
jgi:hypothetical protein